MTNSDYALREAKFEYAKLEIVIFCVVQLFRFGRIEGLDCIGPFSWPECTRAGLFSKRSVTEQGPEFQLD